MSDERWWRLFCQSWWEIGTVHDWQRRMQPALAALSVAYRRDVCGIDEIEYR